MPLGGREHGDRRSAAESASLGADALPPLPRLDPDDRDEDDRLDDGPPAPGARRAPQRRRRRRARRRGLGGRPVTRGGGTAGGPPVLRGRTAGGESGPARGDLDEVPVGV